MPKIAHIGTRDTATAPTDAEALTGAVVERVVYANPGSGFCVLRARMPGQRRPVTVVGYGPGIVPGETIAARGRWVKDPGHGLQFRAESLASSLASDGSGVEACLAGGLIKGIGERYARRLVAAFGERVLEVIEREPHRLREVPGIGAARARRIAEAWSEQKAARETVAALNDLGIGAARAMRLWHRYGAETVALLRDDPYRLTRDLPGFGFAEADAAALRLGIAPDAPVRSRAGILHALGREIAAEGHCALPGAVLVERARSLLRLPRATIDATLADLVAAGDLVADAADRSCFFPAALHAAERQVAARLRRLAAGPPPWGAFDAADAVRTVEHAHGIALSQSQCRAATAVLAAKVAVLTGGPGVGKTLLIDVVVRILRGRGTAIRLAAPTGRAAKRLADCTGLEARTLHRLLEYDPVAERFGRDAANPLPADLVIVDEASMVDLPLLAALLQAVPDRAALLLVGDADQLPSIGPGQVLADILASQAVASVRLEEVFRQRAGSRIIRAAHAIRAGAVPEPVPRAEESDFHFVPARDPADALAKIVTMATDRIPRRFRLDPLRDVQVLCPTNEGPVGTRTLNLELQRALNGGAGAAIHRGGWRFRTGDRVMQVENDYERDIYNGDLGTVVSVDPDAGRVRVAFAAGRGADYAGEALERLSLAYAISIHKAQGSEYPAVVIPVMPQHGRMLNRTLLYTAVTRGRRLVVLVGDAAALERALERAAPVRRSLLRDRLR